MIGTSAVPEMSCSSNSRKMHVLSPGVWALSRPKPHEDYNHFAAFLERRGSLEYLACRIEHFEEELTRAEQNPAPGDADGRGEA